MEIKKAAEPRGLVHSETSDVSRPNFFEMDREKARLKRLRCSVITSARLIQESMTKGGHRFKVAFVTLTYARIDGYSSRHVSKLIQHCREFSGRRGFAFRYVWVMELQKRGAPHYHLILWLPKGLTLPKPDKRGWWPHGSTRIEWARNPVGYAAKYASKGEENARYPKGARIYGIGGLGNADRVELRYWRSPLWFRRLYPEVCDCKKVVGGIVHCESGVLIYSPWFVHISGGRTFLYWIGGPQWRECASTVRG